MGSVAKVSSSIVLAFLRSEEPLLKSKLKLNFPHSMKILHFFKKVFCRCFLIEIEDKEYVEKNVFEDYAIRK